MLTSDQVVRILIIVLPILITVLGDGRYTRQRLDDLIQRIVRLEERVEKLEHPDPQPAGRRR